MHLLSLVIEYIRSNPAAVATVGGVVTPLVIAVLQQPRLASWQRSAVSVAASVVIGGAVALSTGMFDDAKSLITVLVVLYTVSKTFYQKLWSKVGLTQKIEAKTTVGAKAPATEVLDDEGE